MLYLLSPLNDLDSQVDRPTQDLHPPIQFQSLSMASNFESPFVEVAVRMMLVFESERVTHDFSHQK